MGRLRQENAFNLLERYHDRLPSFNDDIQGTGATAAAALRTAFQTKGRPASNERIAILGFGQAGSGVANALCTLMAADDGISIEEARRRIFAIDVPGLLMEGMSVEANQKNFLQPKALIQNWPIPKDRAPNLAEVVKHAKITTLIGLSAQPGVFSAELMHGMLEHTDRPIICCLSNPTSKCEATPETIVRATEGRALIATGSPFAPVTHDGRQIHVSQCNNLYIFPGVGLGSIVCQASKVTHRMFHAATVAISDMVTAEKRAAGYLLPPLKNIRDVSFNVALAVARQARDEQIGIQASDERLAALIKAAMWTPHYYPYRLKRS